MFAKNDWMDSGAMLRAAFILLGLSLILREFRGECETFLVYVEVLFLGGALGCITLGFCELFRNTGETRQYRRRERVFGHRGLQLLCTFEDFGRACILFNPYAGGRWTEAKIFALLSLLLALICLCSPAEKTLLWLFLVFAPLPAFCGTLASVYRHKALDDLANEWHFTAAIVGLALLCAMLAFCYLGFPSFIV